MPVTFHYLPEDEQAADLSIPAVTSPMTKKDAQELALRVALWGAGKVTPNPLVGAVIVDENHQFLGAGAHLQVGGPHAEINAINTTKTATGRTDFSGCTLYSTLEPCAHENRTPACAKKLVAEKFSRVVYGITDPNPAVAGKGAGIIAAAGITCEIDSNWSDRCSRRAEFFLWETRNHTPFVGLKSAISLDGAIARRGDQRTWITGERARAMGHYLRVKYDAIVVGAWTLVHDNPSLLPRESLAPGPAPWRVVVDPSGRGLHASVSEKLQLLQAANEKVLWIVAAGGPAKVKQATDKYPHIKIVALPIGSDGFIEPDAILSELYSLGITSVLLEGGSGLYRPFIVRNKVNRYHLFQTAKLLCGDNKINFFEGETDAFDNAADDVEITALGQDWLTEFSGRTKKQ